MPIGAGTTPRFDGRVDPHDAHDLPVPRPFARMYGTIAVRIGLRVALVCMNRNRAFRLARLAATRTTVSTHGRLDQGGCAPLEPPQRGKEVRIQGGRVGGGITAPRPSQTRACGFPALGSSLDRFAPRPGPRARDPGRWQGVLLEQRIHPVPVHPPPTVTACKPCPPDANELVAKPPESFAVPGFRSVIGAVTPKHPGKMLALRLDRQVPVPFAPDMYRLQRASEATFRRDLAHHVLASSSTGPKHG